ncbi:MAG: hypothetical protein FJ194_06855 [Gammaproteobacteria bacterium]|nr:hypothetical protein [Gammaproteobacteria bacterium]
MILFLRRDLIILLVTVTLWLLTPEFQTLSLPAAIGAVLCAFQFHEWGHWLGGRRVQAVMTPASVWWSPFLFQFDGRANSRQQFLHMSWPGFVATALFIACFEWGLPAGHPSTALTQDIGRFLAGITVVIEGPLALWTLLGGRVPPVPVWLPGRRKSTGED